MNFFRPFSLLQIFSSLLLVGALFLFISMAINAYVLGSHSYTEALDASFAQKTNLAQQAMNNEIERLDRTISFWATHPKIADNIKTSNWRAISQLINNTTQQDELLTLDLFYITDLNKTILDDQSSPFYLSKLLFREIIRNEGKSQTFLFQEEHGPQFIYFKKEKIVHPDSQEVIAYLYGGISLNHWLELIGNITTITQSKATALYSPLSSKPIISTIDATTEQQISRQLSKLTNGTTRLTDLALHLAPLQLGEKNSLKLLLIEETSAYRYLQRRYLISAILWLVTILLFSGTMIGLLHRVLSKSLNQLLSLTQIHHKDKERQPFSPTFIREFNTIGRTIDEMLHTIRQNESVFKTIFDHSLQFKGLLSSDGSVIAANKHSLENQKIELKDIKGKKFWATPWWAHSADLQQKVKQAIDKAKLGQTSQFEAIHQAPDGQMTQVLFTLNPVKDELGNTILMIPEGLDITTVKQAENILSKHNQDLERQVEVRTKEQSELIEKLKQTNKQVALITAAIESSNEAVIIVGDQGSVLYYNHAFANIFKPAGESISSIFEIFPERAHIQRKVDELKNGGTWIEKLSTRVANGSTQDFLLNANLIKEDSGETHGRGSIVMVFSDLTALVKTEEKLHQAELDRYIAINANRAKSSFLANMSHELRTPLHCISSFTNLAHKKLHASDYTKISGYLDTVTECTHELSDLIDQLLLLSSLEAGLIHYTMRQYSIDALLDEVKKHFEKKLESKKLNFSYRSNNAAVRAYFDSHHMVHVFHGLMANAIKYSSPMTSIDVVVDDYWENDRLYTIVSFKNTGLPIPKEELEIIFSDFNKQSTEKTNAGGTGLGLSICRRIIEDHKGKIWATSSAEGLTEICMLLPKNIEE